MSDSPKPLDLLQASSEAELSALLTRLVDDAIMLAQAKLELPPTVNVYEGVRYGAVFVAVPGTSGVRLWRPGVGCLLATVEIDSCIIPLARLLQDTRVRRCLNRVLQPLSDVICWHAERTHLVLAVEAQQELALDRLLTCHP